MHNFMQGFLTLTEVCTKIWIYILYIFQFIQFIFNLLLFQFSKLKKKTNTPAIKTRESLFYFIHQKSEN